MTRTKQQFDFLMEFKGKHTPGSKTSDEMIELTRNLWVGHYAQKSPAYYRAKKLITRMEALGDFLSEWNDWGFYNQVEKMQALTSGRSLMDKTIKGVALIVETGCSEWEASKEVDVYVDNIKSANAKYNSFAEAAKQYKALL